MMPQVEVAGPTIRLRYGTAADASRLLDLASDPLVTRWFSWGPYTDLAQPQAYLDRLPVAREDGELLDFIVEHDTHGPIGVTGLSEVNARNRTATVGTWFGRDHWGTGSNSESKALIAHLAFEHLGFDRLTAWANPRNGRSQRALEDIGFVREGVLRGWHRHGEVRHDTVVFRFGRAEWERSPLRSVPATVTGRPPAAFVVG